MTRKKTRHLAGLLLTWAVTLTEKTVNGNSIISTRCRAYHLKQHIKY